MAGVGWAANRRTPVEATQATLFAECPPGPEEVQFRLGLWNIRRGKGIDGQRDLSRIATDLDGLDVVVLNEVGGGWSWLGKPDQAADLGSRLDLDGHFFAAERRYFRDHFGNALLTRFPLMFHRRTNLERTHSGGFRQLVEVHVCISGRTVRMLIAHLDTKQDRESQLAHTIQRFRALEPPAILAGDLNSNESDPLLARLLAEGFAADALAGTSVKGWDGRRDWVLTRGLTVRRGELRDSVGSDHPLFVVEIDLASDGGAQARIGAP